MRQHSPRFILNHYHLFSIIFLLIQPQKPMKNTLNIDETILAEALALSDNQTTEDVINTALQEYIQHRRQLQIIELFNTIDYDPDYDYKQQRKIS